MKRIDSLEPGTLVHLRFGRELQGDGAEIEAAVFMGIDGTGEERRAWFNQSGFEWGAYRYEGRWVYGSSAESLRLVEILKED